MLPRAWARNRNGWNEMKHNPQALRRWWRTIRLWWKATHEGEPPTLTFGVRETYVRPVLRCEACGAPAWEYRDGQANRRIARCTEETCGKEREWAMKA